MVTISRGGIFSVGNFFLDCLLSFYVEKRSTFLLSLSVSMVYILHFVVAFFGDTIECYYVEEHNLGRLIFNLALRSYSRLCNC